MQNFDLVDEAMACHILGGEHTPIHRSTFWRGIKAGRYPKPLKIGPGTNRWRIADLQAVIERAAGARESTAA